MVKKINKNLCLKNLISKIITDRPKYSHMIYTVDIQRYTACKHLMGSYFNCAEVYLRNCLTDIFLSVNIVLKYVNIGFRTTQKKQVNHTKNPFIT